jgi:crossover junction endodeoxyribonuclease RuvC
MILGIDPGVRKMGYAIITSQLQIIDAGVIIIDTPGKIHREDYRSRMTHMRQFFVDLLLQFPDIHAASVEKLFAFRNHNNIEYVYGIRGMLMSLLQEHGCQLYEYTPLQLKKYIA